MAARLPSRRARILGGVVLLALFGVGALWATRGPATVFDTAPVKRGNIEASVTVGKGNIRSLVHGVVAAEAVK